MIFYCNIDKTIKKLLTTFSEFACDTNIDWNRANSVDLPRMEEIYTLCAENKQLEEANRNV